MKIVFVLTQSLDSPSGLGRYTPLASALAQRGHQVDIIALHPDWDQLPQRQLRIGGISVNYVSQMHVQKRGPRKSYFGPSRLMRVSIVATVRLTQALWRSNADIIHLGKAQPFNTLAGRLARRGRPLFCDCDDYEAETNRFSHPYQKRIVRYFEDGITRQADGLTVNTRFTRDRYVALGYPAQRIVTIPNGVDRERFSSSSGRPIIRQKLGITANAPLVAYVGSLGLKSHPVDLLIRAFIPVQRAYPAAKLLIVGGGEDFDALRTMVAESGLAEAVTLTGRVAAEDVPDYLSAADVSVDPVHDDFIARARSPLKIVESLAVGVPVVTSDVGDRRTMLEDGKMGLLVRPGSSEALAEGIATLLGQPDMLQSMKVAAQAGRQEWYWDRLVDDFLEFYERILPPLRLR